MSHTELLRELAIEEQRLREQAAQSVERGMQRLMDGRRVIQKCPLDETNMEQVLHAYLKLMATGCAHRVFLQSIESHHQRGETPWSDTKSGISQLLRAASQFEGSVSEFLTLIRNETQRLKGTSR